MAPHVLLERAGVKSTWVGGGSHWALQEVSLSWQAGERLGIIGRNGSGKTTLARLLSGLERLAEGRRQMIPKGSRILLVLQRPEDQFVKETVSQQVNSYAPDRMADGRLATILDEVGLPANLTNASPYRLSAGQQRLVAVACALAAEAPFIILDEPMAGLDSQNRRLVHQALANLKREVGLAIISHHPDDLLGLVERLWLLADGRLIYDGRFDESPLSELAGCLGERDGSLYFALRRLENRGVAVPKAAYRQREPEVIARLLDGKAVG